MIHSKCWKGKRCKLGYSTGEGNGTPLQYSCLENPMDGGAWWDAVHGVTESWTWLGDFTFTFHFSALEKEMATHSCSCLENPREGGAWWAAVYGVAQSQTRLKRLSSSNSIYRRGLNEWPAGSNVLAYNTAIVPSVEKGPQARLFMFGNACKN